MLEEKIPELARKAIEEYILYGRVYQVEPGLEEKLQKARGVFVSLKKNGNLRGCIGTIEPAQKNIAREIVNNAISACSHDPRFPAVQSEELPELDISVDIIGEKERAFDKDELDPDKYGVIVQQGQRKGLLLPDLDGVDTVEKQLDIARQKAGILPGEDIEIYRFTVERYQEE